MKVFVSSTTKDLGDAREKVCKQIAGLDNQYVCMDCYTASGRPPAEFDDSEVKKCEAFVLIVAHYYGSCPPGKDKSFTELEYEAAVASDKPIYPFLASEAFPVSPNLREDDATYQKLQAFRERLGRDHAPKPFDSIDDLRAAVAAAVPRPTEQSGRISVPKLPQAYLAHPYPIQEHFTGRVKERTMLTDWVAAADSRPMLSLVGMGGLGKSALTWYWLHEDLPQENLKFSGVIWWSFYEQEASFESFLAHALLYASGGTIDPAQLPSDYDRMQSLWCILRETPFLIVFDGAERLLRAYHALDIAYKGDDFTEQAGDSHLLCADPRAGQFLQWLASPGVRTRTLLTTRLHPKELEGLAGCRREELQHLEPDDAVEFMRRQGVKGPRNAIVHACEPYDFLPLCIRLLSGAIRQDPERPGDIVVAEDWHPPENLVRREHHILQLAYDTMAKDRRDLLSRIAAMRGPVDYDTAKALSTYDDENELKDALRELVARGLLLRREGQVHYDLHPIIRQYAYDRLGDKAATHETLKDYFDTVPKPEKIEGLDDLMPTIELFHHTIRAGAYEEAFSIYRDRLATALYYQLGAYDTRISLSEAFFPDGTDKPPRLEDESKQAWLLNGLAITCEKTGQSRNAVGLLERNMAIREKQGRKKSIATVAGNLAISRILLGEMEAAESNLRRCVDIAGELTEKVSESTGHQELGRLLTYMGRYDQADKELETALAMDAEQNHEQGQCISWSYRALRALMMDEPKSALEALETARQFWGLDAQHDAPVERDLVRILWSSGAAKRGTGDAAGAEGNLNEALSRCRRIRLVEFEADILLEMARLQWQKAQGKNAELIEQVKSLTREALEIADRCEHRLQQADIHNFLARMALAENDKATSLKHAEIAKERAFCDGPPHCYKKALNEAEEMLAKLQ
jgi:tetratricopeptide (TPR) repeat protein